MLKFIGKSNAGRTVYFLGLSAGNIARLTAGQPIAVNLKDMNGPDLEIGILYGETEQSLLDDLRAVGTVRVGTVINNQRRNEVV